MSTTISTHVPMIRKPSWTDTPLWWATDFETFLKLKYIHKCCWQTVYDVARWVRWDRKTVHQHGPEPKYCPLFVLEKGHTTTFEDHKGNVHYRWHPKTMDDLDFMKAYQIARMPCKTKEEAEEGADRLPSRERIEETYEECRKYFG